MKTSALDTNHIFFSFPLFYRIRDYFYSGILLHLITIAAGYAAYLVIQITMVHYLNGDSQKMLVYGYLSVFMISIPVFAQLDARSRYQDFKMLRDLFYKFGFHFRFARAVRHSRCQRDAAIFAAKILGYDHMIVKYYDRCGYRWYNLFPDFIFSNPLYLFHRKFWETTFFAKKYKVRYFNEY